MVEQIKWVELKFDFSLPAGKYPAILERVFGTPVRLEEMLRDKPEELLKRKVNNGWSVQEHVGHLIDLEELHVKRLDEFEAGAVTLSAADMTNAKTNAANHNGRNISDVLADFRKGRNEMMQRLRAYDEDFIVKAALHPRLNVPMRVMDLALFVAEHDDHHLATIRYLLNH